MSDREMFDAEMVFSRDFLEGGAGNIMQPKTKLQWKPSLYLVSLSQIKASPSVSAQSENTPNHVAALTASMETAADKHRGISQQHCHDTFGSANVSSGCFANGMSVSDDRMSHTDTHTQTPTNTGDLFPTPASSRESVLSEGSDKEKSWSAMPLSSVTSPASFSCPVSPSSSVRSGIFSPTVIQIKRHFLAPGSSLVHIPQNFFSSCDSLSSSTCPQSPPPRHRPPLTRLSLLTAILRKGRLPVLSSALQRPYTPCWPVNAVTLSFCKACSAANSVASIPLEISSQFFSSASIDIPSQGQKEPNRCVTAPPSVLSHEFSRTCTQSQVKTSQEQIHSSGVPRWKQVISPPPLKSNALPRSPLSLFCSNFKSVTQPKQEELSESATFKNLQYTRISKSPGLISSSPHLNLKGQEDNNFKNLTSPSTKSANEQKSSVPQRQSQARTSSLSRLHLLSERLREPPVCPPQLQLSQTHTPGVTVVSAHRDTASPLPRLQNITGRCESKRSCPGATLPAGFHKAHCLSPSRYTPIVFPGWPSPTSSSTPSPSPAPPIRDLTPSPSFSLRSTPSPRPGSGISDCSDREGKKRKTHRIKLSYKSLAAIPTNTLLLDQQAMDEQVEREESPCDAMDRCVADTHAEMCSPAQLRQQSEELYAVIDEILANSTSACKTSLQPSNSSTTSVALKNNSSLPKSLGRETKYASICSLHPSAGVERKLMHPKMTKRAVIRPMTAIPRLTVEDKGFHPNPPRHFVVKQIVTDNTKVRNMSREEARKDFCSSSKGQTSREERKPERRSAFSVCDLQITEPEDQISHHAKDGSAST